MDDQQDVWCDQTIIRFNGIIIGAGIEAVEGRERERKPGIPRSALAELRVLVSAAHMGLTVRKPALWRPFGTEEAAVRALYGHGPPAFSQPQVKNSLHRTIPNLLMIWCFDD